MKGDEKARRGYAFIYGNADDWDVIRESHEKSIRTANGGELHVSALPPPSIMSPRKETLGREKWGKSSPKKRFSCARSFAAHLLSFTVLSSWVV